MEGKEKSYFFDGIEKEETKPETEIDFEALCIELLTILKDCGRSKTIEEIIVNAVFDGEGEKAIWLIRKTMETET